MLKKGKNPFNREGKQAYIDCLVIVAPIFSMKAYLSLYCKDIDDDTRYLTLFQN